MPVTCRTLDLAWAIRAWNHANGHGLRAAFDAGELDVIRRHRQQAFDTRVAPWRETMERAAKEAQDWRRVRL